MSEGAYVKLTKDQRSLNSITPGELNQPIDVEALNACKCEECGQTLPPTYVPPADEDWTTGIFGCAEDPQSCWTGLFCPCMLFGHNVERLNTDLTWNSACACHAICVEGGLALAALTGAFHGVDPDTSFLIWEGLLFAWWMCGIYTGMARQSLQRRYHLKNSPCDPCLVHCCLHWCAICQEHREMQNHLSQNASTPTAVVVNPPPFQEMSADNDKKQDPSSSSSSGKDDENSNLETSTTA